MKASMLQKLFAYWRRRCLYTSVLLLGIHSQWTIETAESGLTTVANKLWSLTRCQRPRSKTSRTNFGRNTSPAEYSYLSSA